MALNKGLIRFFKKTLDGEYILTYTSGAKKV